MTETQGRKEADFEILKGDRYKWMFRDDLSNGGDGYISYRHFISHIIWSSLKSGKNEVEIKNFIKELKEICTDPSKKLSSSDFVEVKLCHDDGLFIIECQLRAE